MVNSSDMRDDSLEQAAAHIGYRPWREFCALKERIRELEGRLHTARHNALHEFARRVVDEWDVAQRFAAAELAKLMAGECSDDK